MDFSAGVGQAPGFLHPARFGQYVITCIGISLQYALILCQVELRMFSFAICRMSTTDEKWFFRNLGGRKWMKLSGEQGSKLF